MVKDLRCTCRIKCFPIIDALNTLLQLTECFLCDTSIPMQFPQIPLSYHFVMLNPFELPTLQFPSLGIRNSTPCRCHLYHFIPMPLGNLHMTSKHHIRCHCPQPCPSGYVWIPMCPEWGRQNIMSSVGGARQACHDNPSRHPSYDQKCRLVPLFQIFDHFSLLFVLFGVFFVFFTT